MLSHFSKFAVTAALCASLTSLQALADGASQATSSDVSHSDPIELNFEIDSSPITVKNWVLKLDAGAGFQNSPEGSGEVGKIQIEASRRYPLKFNGHTPFDIHSSEMGWDVELQPGVYARLDASQLDGETRSHISRQDFTISGANLLHGWYCGEGTHSESCDSDDTTNTLDLTIVNVAGRWFANSYLHTKERGLQLTVLQGSAHAGVNFLGIPMDFCAQLASGAVLGRYSIGDQKRSAAFFAEVSACAGFEIGSLAEVRDNFMLRFDNDRVAVGAYGPESLSISNTVSIDHIGSRKNPVGLYWTYSRETAGSFSKTNAPVVSNFFGLEVNFDR